ncbi:HD-GYP domain-containing protein [Ideonella oryzae]|uniref:HD domain-containing protein n=1 Tax=Ideonella oryzae TaxID=2937441 RepID=A0ABT1BHE0_9BURK|nr:HD domain-containing phosphohydrolase [Ideonella oryzae]MCO5975239.1 HD domain-containing protein [Ideonella oryzae]
MNAPLRNLPLPGDANRFDTASAAQMEQLVMDLRQMYRERNAALEEVAAAHHEALLRLALAADYRDTDTGNHIIRIGYLSEALALLLGLSSEAAAMLRKAAPMHDIGKIGVADAVLKKPGPLDPEERRQMNEHAAIGAHILGRSRIPLFQMAAEVAQTHHERWDGRGYPAGLAGNAIPITGRIVAVADYFDALAMDRVYRPAFSVGEALSMLAGERGRSFDPQVVDMFIAHAQALVALRERINQGDGAVESLAGAPLLNVRKFLSEFGTVPEPMVASGAWEGCATP